MHRFRLEAVPDPQSLPRIVNFFAQRALVPSAVSARTMSGHMRVEIVVAGLGAEQAAIIAAKLSEVVAILRSGVEAGVALPRLEYAD